MRQRPAPNAARTATSRSRTVARASSRFATFTQTISRTKKTAPNSNQQCRLRSSYNLFVQRLHRDAPILVRAGILSRQAFSNHVEGGLGLR